MLSIGCLTLIQSAAIVMQAKWLAEVISALFAGELLNEQFTDIMLFLLAFLLRHGTALLQQRIAYRFAEKTGESMRKGLINQLFTLGPIFARQQGAGSLVTLVREGVLQFRTFLELFLPRMMGTAITPVLILIYIYMQDVWSGIILTVTMPILIIFMILIGLAARRQMERQRTSYQVLSNHFVDSLRGLETLKFLGQSRAHSETIGRVSDKYRSATMRTLRVAFLSSFALDFFTMLSVATVAVSLGLRLVEGNMVLVTALTVLILAPEYFLPVRMVGADYHATLNGKEAGEAIQSIIDQPSVDMEPSDHVPRPFWTKDSTLQLSHIHLQREEDGTMSLDDVSIQLHGIQKVGIIGESGAGKSSLIDVLAGFFHPTSGTIKVDGIEVSSLANEWWQEQVTYIPQHPYIFGGSLADNVRFYAPEASMGDVKEAVHRAGLSDLAEKLPNGYDEIIGNGGRQLSGGQEQRVALARAFLCRRPIILLDEPTAHLDIETETELKETMLSLFEDKLVLLATHRLHWMTDMDYIIVMDQGKVAESGTHEDLLARKGAYYKMIHSGLGGA